TVTVPDDWAGKQGIANLGSVTSCVDLWINGRVVGYSEDSKLEPEFDITPYLRKGENEIAMQVFRWCDGTYLEDQDFWRLSGMARDCYLYARDKSAGINDLRITPDLDADYRDGSLDVKLDLRGKCSVALDLTSPDGKSVATASVNGPGKKNVTLSVTAPAKWTAETPNLYVLTATVTNNAGKVVEVVPFNVGFRKVEIKNSQVLVNGQPVLFKGADRHELDPDGGYVVSRERMLQDIKIMKENNINAVRTCHYPDDPYWYDLCDRYGIYLVAEANLESHGMGYKEKTLAKVPAYAKAHMERNERNVQRNFNHPSIIFWSMGNEAGDGENFTQVYKWLKAEDPSRPVQYERAGMGDNTDIFCPMYYTQSQCDKYCKSTDPAWQKPLIQCEYAHAMGNSGGGFKEYWDLVRKYPKYQGGFIWDFVDQGLRGTGKNGAMIYTYGGDYNPYDASDNNFCDNGLISPDRVPNPHMAEVAYYYQNIWATPVDLAKGEIKVFNENFFKNLDNYYMRWTLKNDGAPVQQGLEAMLDIAPQQSRTYTLPYDMSAVEVPGELLLDVEFVTKNADGLLPAGHVAARAQMAVTTPAMADPVIANVTSISGIAAKPEIVNNNTKRLRVVGSNFNLDFNRTTGFISHYNVNGVSMLEEGAEITPNFWRAGTDNDYGAKVPLRRKVWRNPEMKLKSLTHKMTADGLAQVTAEYDMPDVKSTLTMTYLINNVGAVLLDQQMKATAGADVPEMIRFGVQIPMPEDMDISHYYGRGTVENYNDRHAGAPLGVYTQTAAQQSYSYIRPQEMGTKSDMRWWAQTNRGHRGLKFTSSQPFYASALNYSIESLDDGDNKDQRHTPEVATVDYVNLLIDSEHTGVGGADSWSDRGLPLPQYRVNYGDKSLRLLITPVSTPVL
ncbi:MAG: DUF4981 domain-containing protein, partial [Muribaculaceae bacterium]|nr:DUF4981 domain-containing protein [Muribaculaceae bacterium]